MTAQESDKPQSKMLKIDQNFSYRDGSWATCATLIPYWDRKSESEHSEMAAQELDILRDALCNKVLAIKDMVLQELKRKEQSYRNENKDLENIATAAKTENSELKRENIEKDLALLQLTLQLKNIKETVKGEEIAILKLKRQVKSIVELKTENTKLRSQVFVLKKQKKSIQELYCETTKELENALINANTFFVKSTQTDEYSYSDSLKKKKMTIGLLYYPQKRNIAKVIARSLNQQAVTSIHLLI